MKNNNNLIILKKKYTLNFGSFSFKCSIGKGGLSSEKKEGDKKTPKGTYKIGDLFYRKDREKKPKTKLNCKNITSKMGWCNNSQDKKNYNRLISIKKNTRFEKLFRKDYKYDFMIPILYNSKKILLGRGSAIFIHLTKNYLTTAGCITLKRKDFLILLKLINKNTKIKIS